MIKENIDYLIQPEAEREHVVCMFVYTLQLEDVIYGEASQVEGNGHGHEGCSLVVFLKQTVADVTFCLVCMSGLYKR